MKECKNPCYQSTIDDGLCACFSDSGTGREVLPFDKEEEVYHTTLAQKMLLPIIGIVAIIVVAIIFNVIK